MKTYTVHRRRAGEETPGAELSSPRLLRHRRWVRNLIFGDEDAVVFVKEGVCWPAAAFTLLWALWHRLWAFALCLCAVGVALGVFLDALEPDPIRDLTLIIAVLILIGCFANDARRRALAWRGYDFVGVVVGNGADGAAQRFLDGPDSTAEGSRP